VTWGLHEAGEADLDELMTWFPDAASVEVWGGPGFRYPFSPDTFREDCRLSDFRNYCLRDGNGAMAAFGQLGARYGRAHLARLVADPERRGERIGSRLVQMLVEASSISDDCDEIALFVMRDNAPARRCYEGMGFSIHTYPDDAPMPDQCYYMTRPLP
jgi:ribosomal protein S18 acetylase RimI-like enzyme